MEKYTISHPKLAAVTVSMPSDLQQQADIIATQHGETLSELICLVLASYIETYSKQSQAETSRISLEQARALMRQFGQGLGTGNAPHNGAQYHDEYLYGHK